MVCLSLGATFATVGLTFHRFLPLCRPCLACCLPLAVASRFFLLAAASFFLPAAVDFNLLIVLEGA